MKRFIETKNRMINKQKSKGRMFTASKEEKYYA
jgi:hypothetical protein